MAGTRGSERRRGALAVFSAIAIVVATAAFFTVPASAAVRHGTTPDDTSGAAENPAIAKLVLEHDQVDLRKADKTAFKAAHDGQVLHEGDTLRTDETGRATILYSDASYTRLDVNTEFTIVSLTDDEGTRDTSGELGVGRVWNRVEDLAEGENFSTAGAGATAAVTGTANTVECVTLDECTFTGIFHTTSLSGDGDDPPLDVGELQHVTVKLGAPGPLGSLSLEDFDADAWIQENLSFDEFLGFDGPTRPRHVTIVTFGGAIVVPVEVGGITVDNPTDDPEPPPPPPTGAEGYGAGGGTNAGGATFDGRGNCMAASTGNGKPDPQACLDG